MNDLVTAQNEKFCGFKAIDPDVVKQRTDAVGAQVGDELAHDGLMALAVVVIGVMAYLAIRFEWKYAVSAIIANLHDVVIILGFSLFWLGVRFIVWQRCYCVGLLVNESVVILIVSVRTS